MARTKKSKFSGTGYQKLNERIAILENTIKNALIHLSNNDVQEANRELWAGWTRESNL